MSLPNATSGRVSRGKKGPARHRRNGHALGVKSAAVGIRAAKARSLTKIATFSWVRPITLTTLCAMKCGYCSYTVEKALPLPSLKRFQSELEQARAMGIAQLRLIAGEGIETHPRVIQTVRYYGYPNYANYLTALLGETLCGDVSPTFCELDMGAMRLAPLQRIRPNLFTLRLYLETLDPRLQANGVHGASRNKWPRHRLSALLTAARLGIPVNSGIMVGLGETEESRRLALEMLSQIARRHRNIQSVALHPFVPTSSTPWENRPAPKVDDLITAIGWARSILPDEVGVVAPGFRYPDAALEFLRAGADDLGDFDLTGNAKTDAATFDAFRKIETALGNFNIRLRDRLSIWPKFANARWLTPKHANALELKQR